MAVLGDLMVLTFSQRGGFLKHPTPGGVPVSTTSPGWRVMNLYTHIGHNQCTISFSWKIWRGIKFGGSAVRVETAKLKSTNIVFTQRVTMQRMQQRSWPCLVPTRAVNTASTSTLPVIAVNLQNHGFVQIFQATGRQCSLIHVHAMFMMTKYTARHHSQM